MKIRSALAILALLAGCGGEPDHGTPVRLEFRAADTEPSDGLVAYRLWNGATFYLADSVLLDNRDVARARVRVREGKAEVEMVLTEEGTARLAGATELRLGQRIGMLVDGRLISAPVVQQPITAGWVLLRGNFWEEEAWRIAHGLGAQRSSR
jgi:preprotein translocase subunit SecD